VEISCTPSRTNINTNESVTWTANAQYGTGYYTYSWSGTDSVSGNMRDLTKTYSSSGTKTASVAVTSGGKTFYQDCGTVYVNANQDQNLTGSCSVSDSNVNIDDSVNWSANASGGTGSYTYTWNGSSPLSGRTGSNTSVRYSSYGTKTGSVTIRSGDQTITRDCGDVYVEDYNNNYNNYGDFNVSCNVNNTYVNLGQVAIWNAYVTGGNGNYNYSWSGTDGIYGNGSSVSKSFNTLGTKIATVTVTSNGRTRSLTCPTVVVGNLGYANQGNVAGLTSVYLNQVPYTGVEDNPKFWAFIIGLFMFSALGAYIIVSKKAKAQRLNKILDFKNENMARKGVK